MIGSTLRLVVAREGFTSVLYGHTMASLAASLAVVTSVGITTPVYKNRYIGSMDTERESKLNTLLSTHTMASLAAALSVVTSAGTATPVSAWRVMYQSVLSKYAWLVALVSA